MTMPPDVTHDGRTRVLLAVVHGARYYNEIRKATGLSTTVIYRHLHALRDMGMVDFVDKRKGTLVPLVYEEWQA